MGPAAVRPTAVGQQLHVSSSTTPCATWAPDASSATWLSVIRWSSGSWEIGRGGLRYTARAGLDMEAQIELIAAGDPARRMQQIDVASAVLLGVERTLDDERTEMAAAHQPGLAGSGGKPEFELGVPAAWCCTIACAHRRGGIGSRNIGE